MKVWSKASWLEGRRGKIIVLCTDQAKPSQCNYDTFLGPGITKAQQVHAKGKEPGC